MSKGFIRIGGAREHNLKNLTLEVPRDKLVVITGPSGSGKSSLAFDTIFAEGQRKYMESLSVHTRQFLDQIKKPEVDYIEGLSPTIAIEQRSAGGNPRSLIATTTEIYDYLRLLFAHIGQAHCPVSGEPIRRQTTSDLVDQILALAPGTRVMLLAPVVTGARGEFRDVLERLAREGFVRARIDGRLVELSPNQRWKLDPRGTHHIEVVVDRLVIDPKIAVRLADSVATALKWGEGKLLLLSQAPGMERTEEWKEEILSNRLYSPATGETFDPLTPKHFSFNSPLGACPKCRGLGQRLVFDPDLVVPDPEKSLEQGAVAAWQRGGKRISAHYQQLLRGLAGHYGVGFDVPYGQLPESFRQILLHGSGEEEVELSLVRGGKVTRVKKRFEGVLFNLKRLYEESEGEGTRNRLKAYMSAVPCDACQGQRLKREVLAVTIGGRAGAGLGAEGVSIMGICSMTIEEAESFFWRVKLSDADRKVAGEIIREIASRLRFLKNVGLGYLTLNRESGTLSGGEAQRIRLATQIGAGLVGILYILDEPSIGLHARDNEKLLATLEGLRDLGNSVLVVEHDEETIRRADYVLDLGPGAGIHGGEIVAAGTVEEILRHPRSLTAKYLRGEWFIGTPRGRVKPTSDQGWLVIEGARENNLKEIDVAIPLGTLTCVTGVSGSGKSTLVDGILRRALFRLWYRAKERPGAHRGIRGLEDLDKAVVIDQDPIGRTPRSNPATYTGVFHAIRDLYARLPAARVRGYGPARFSFNLKGGRCEKCQGDGLIRIDMQFMPPVYVTCEKCGGRRYNRETLEITYKGRNIADVLEMTVDEAVTFFRHVPRIHEPCVTLAEVGLGYVGLGQSATTLSGGEAQRVKLAAELNRKSTGQTLYILDEPTTGLHFHDVAKLLEVLFKLRDAGNTLLVIEHNLDVIKTADWIIDLGPEGGEGGGRVVAAGPPEAIARVEAGYTGRFLRSVLMEKSGGAA